MRAARHEDINHFPDSEGVSHRPQLYGAVVLLSFCSLDRPRPDRESPVICDIKTQKSLKYNLFSCHPLSSGSIHGRPEIFVVMMRPPHPVANVPPFCNRVTSCWLWDFGNANETGTKFTPPCPLYYYSTAYTSMSVNGTPDEPPVKVSPYG